MRSWKSLVKKVSKCPLEFSEEIRNVNIGWAIQFKGGKFGVSILKATKLDKNNFSKIADH